METATKSSGFQVTQLTAINVAKIVTILCLITLALVYGINDYRQVIYLCLHNLSCQLKRKLRSPKSKHEKEKQLSDWLRNSHKLSKI